MIPVPDSEKAILRLAEELVEKCRVSVGQRAAYYRLLHGISETGRYDGTKSLVNLLFKHLDRTAAHIFSPVELRFSIDFENMYPPKIQEMAKVVAKQITREWERNNIDILFGQGVFEALKYGCCLLKQWVQVEGSEQMPSKYRKLVMPWQFGVYNESNTEINEQPCLLETTILTMPEVWRRIWHLPDPYKLFNRIKAHSRHGQQGEEPQSFMHQVLSTSQIQTQSPATQMAPRPGGMVQVTQDTNYSYMAPNIAADVVLMHELWVQDEKDYTTIQFIEPDVLVAPRHAKRNLLIKDSQLHPYKIIQPNLSSGYFWGRSELIDLIEPQQFLGDIAIDIRRMFGLQVDKQLAFTGDSGLPDETFGQFRATGWLNAPPGTEIKDVTAKFPPESIPLFNLIMETMNMLGGFPPIMQGQGEQGVRSQTHAGTLMKTASPTLRDRSLIVERQCASAADLTLHIREAKDAKKYWSRGHDIKEMEQTQFLIAEIPDDRRISVDSHSSSPIFADEHQQLIFALRKIGDLDGEYVLDNLPLPDKELAKERLRQRQQQQQQMMQQLQQTNPEAFAKAIAGTGHKR